ncbi:inosine triphosphate pyrophosphatase-like protein [Cladochytrium replicatum]|nr:inosine triphosphate pyrophosphatase-like protein [Cladochytrium replicatum]
MSLRLTWIDRVLEQRAFVLASGSPRRKDILSKLGIIFTVVPSTFPETLDKSSFPNAEAYATTNAQQKAAEVMDRLLSEQKPGNDLTKPLVVIGADTVVVVRSDDERDVILEKPENADAARAMLRRLADQKSHRVVTGVSILTQAEGKKWTERGFSECTEVTFDGLSEEILDAYITSGEPFDKAGGYGYQGLAAFFIPRINGCYYNVVGFPAFSFLRELGSMASSGLL